MSCSCSGTGTVMARSIESPSDAPYAFRCSCYNGTNRRFPYWDSNKLKEYEILSQQQPSDSASGTNRPRLVPALKRIPSDGDGI
jgi:hypothetical protein